MVLANMSRHINIPIFIPHLGCPNMCVFCNQRTISGKSEFRADSIRGEIEQVLSTVEPSDECEIAFFGGSFTGIERSLMISLLDIAEEYVTLGRVTSIRLSTRPDYINEEIISVLKKYSVKTVELGLQSAKDEVLRVTKRGHLFADEVKACRMLVDAGFDLVGQMMIGLPGSTIKDELATAEFIASVGATYARIYPTVVFKDTELYQMCLFGKYTPLGLEDAVERSALVYDYFLKKGVKIIRVGLCASENLRAEETYYGGPNHSALGELVEGRVMLGRMLEAIEGLKVIPTEGVHIEVGRGFLSRAIGQKRINIEFIKKKYNLKWVKISENENLSDFEIKILGEEDNRGCT